MRFHRLSRYSLLALFVLGACAAPATQTPSPEAAYVGTTPAYEEWLKSHVRTYWEVEPGNGVIPLIYPHPEGIKAIDQNELELFITASSPPEGWFATPLLEDAIAILVSEEIQMDGLDLHQLYEIFYGDVENWSAYDGGELFIQPIIPLEGDEIRTAFERQVLNGARFTSNALIAPHPQAAIAMTEDNPGSIALVPLTSLTNQHTALAIEGVRLSETTIASGKYPLTINLIATSPKEPVGVMRQFLGWLQANLAAGS